MPSRGESDIGCAAVKPGGRISGCKVYANAADYNYVTHVATQLFTAV